MPTKIPNPEPPDPWKAKLQASLKKDRPRSTWLVALFALAAAAGLGLIVWLVYPRPKPPPLFVVACDGLAVAGQEVHGEAWVTAAVGDQAKVQLDGQTVFFSRSTLTDKPEPQEARTDGQGRAVGPGWKIDPPGELRFLVSLKHNDQQGPARDQATLHAWPADSTLLLVQVEHALAESKALAEKHLLDVPLSAGAESALKNAAGAHRLVYLAWEATGPQSYHKTRSWVHYRERSKELPEGPVLKSWEDLGAKLKELAEVFKGNHLAVAGTPAAAKALHEAGYRTTLVGKGEAAAGITQVERWAELEALWKKK